MSKINHNGNQEMEFGIYTLGEMLNPLEDGKRISEHKRMKQMVELAMLSEEAGLDVFGVGESHQALFTASSPQTILAAIASLTERIKLISSVTVLSTLDPVRVYEDFATIDLLSDGRAEIAAGRGSRYGAYKLFGYDLNEYDDIFDEKFELLLQLNKQQPITWSGEYRPPLEDAETYPKPLNGKLPIWRAVGQHFASAMQAGRLGVPMQLAALYGASSLYEKRVKVYWREAEKAGHALDDLSIASATTVYMAEDSQTAFKEYYPFMNDMSQQLWGRSFSKDVFAQAKSEKSAMMVGSPQQIIEKILYQYELFGHTRFLAQMDHGNIPFEQTLKMFEMYVEQVIPAVRKAIKQPT